MALIPGTLPSDTCYGTPQDLLELFAQYLDVPAFALNSKVVFGTSSSGLTADVIWFDTTASTNPIMKITVSGGFVDYIYNYVSNLSAAASLTGTELIALKQGSSMKSVTSGQLGSPTGSIMAWTLGTPPTGFLECDGSALSRTTYSGLYSIIGVTYGTTSVTDFKLPDYRGRFLRGWAHGQSTDPDRASRTDRGDGTTGDFVGTNQADEFKSHTHLGSVSFYYIGNNGSYGWVSRANQDTATTATGGNETRPININVMWCIKY